MHTGLLKVKEVTFGDYIGMRSSLGMKWDPFESNYQAYGRITTALRYPDFRALCSDVAGQSGIVRASFKIKEGMKIPSALHPFISSQGRWVKIPSPCLEAVMTECVECAEKGGYLSVKPRARVPADYEIDFEYDAECVQSVHSAAVLIPASELDTHGWNGSYRQDVRALWISEDADLTAVQLAGGYGGSPLLRQRLDEGGSQLFGQRVESPQPSPAFGQQSAPQHIRRSRSEDDHQQLEQIASNSGRNIFWVKR
ncbi:hypothetical protein HY497_00430 [Candidatus Woesearchaeota archaeon]|nr:hypothetical protein [Candidatus Woesearchaeota archaeon]